MFFCLSKVYNKYGRDGHLTLIYGDKNIGMAGVNFMEKWLVRVLVVLAVVWALLYAYPMYLIYQDGGIAALWDSIPIFTSNRHSRK